MSFLKIRRKKENSDGAMAKLLAQYPALLKDSFGVTEEALMRIRALLAQEGSGKVFRVALRGGGCSGLSLHFEVSTKNPSDITFGSDDAPICVDKKTLSIVGGSTLHFMDFADVSEFLLLHNPVAKQCSCGKSFSL